MDYILPICYILLFYIIYKSYRASKDYMNFLSGYWESDENFNKEAALDTMILYIGEINGAYYANTTTFAVLDPIFLGTMEWSLRAVPWSNKIGIHIEYENDVKVFGDYIVCDVDIDGGMMRLYSSDGVLYGLLYKNNMLSNYSV